MSDRTQTIIAWVIALIVVASCGISAIWAYQTAGAALMSGFNGTMTAVFQNATDAAAPFPTIAPLGG